MTTEPRLHLAIVGGGIGGLSLAVALTKLGLDDVLEIDIYEAATKLAQVGAGITVLPRAWDILKKLGLEKALSELSPTSKAAELEDQQVPAFSYRKSDQRQGIPIVNVDMPGGRRGFHRADIQEALVENTSSSIHFYFSYRLKRYINTPDGIELAFLNGRKATCDLLVGADGINSVVRRHFVDGSADSEHSRPRWTGTVVYRSLVDAETIRKTSPDHPGLRGFVVYCGKNKNIVMYPIQNARYINIVQFISDPSKEGTPLIGPALLNATEEDDVASVYAGWEDDVQCVVKHINKPSKWAIQTVGPLERYASEGVFLLGDAAHAMAPHLGSGAAQAIEDAYVLANLLGKALRQAHFNILRVTDAYNSVRQPFGNFVVDASRQQGRRYELSAPGFEDIEAGDIVSPYRLAELGRLIKGGWEWNWKTTVDDDLERALATLSRDGMS